MTKITVGLMRDLEKKVMKDEISYSRMVEIINETAQANIIEIKQNLISQIDICTKEIEDLHPYKESGNRESYSQYNEGWSDACDILSQKIKNQIEKL